MRGPVETHRALLDLLLRGFTETDRARRWLACTPRRDWLLDTDHAVVLATATASSSRCLASQPALFLGRSCRLAPAARSHLADGSRQIVAYCSFG